METFKWVVMFSLESDSLNEGGRMNEIRSATSKSSRNLSFNLNNYTLSCVNMESVSFFSLQERSVVSDFLCWIMYDSVLV